MKKNIITIVAAMALCLAANSQEVMKVELKNGQVTTFPVEDINRFYFEGAEEQEELAEYCEIEIEDEVVLNNCAAFELDYDIDVEYMCAFYLTAEQASQYTDKQIVTALRSSEQFRYDKRYNIMPINDVLTEGTDYVLLYVGINTEGKRGPLYRHHFKTSVEADLKAKKLIAEVINVKYNSNNFYFTVEADEDMVGEYYVLYDVGNNLTYSQNLAITGLGWKKLMDQDEKMAGQHYFGDDFTVARPNGENTLHVATWSTDAEWDLVGFIYESIWNTVSGSRLMKRTNESHARMSMCRAYTRQELMEQLRKSVKIYRVSKKQ